MSLKDSQHPILYSAMSTLAYNINKKYYGDKHYLWCTPYFGSDFQSPHFTVPPSSSPLEIYNTLKNEVDGADLHNTKIKLNRRGIRNGAGIMLKLKKITQEIHDEIVAVSKLAKDQQFKPLLCVISRLEAVPFYQKVDVKDRANPLWDRAMLSKRFIIETINDQLKNISYIEHSRHRSMKGFMLNLLAGLVAYCLKENKPRLNLTDVEHNAMVVA